MDLPIDFATLRLIWWALLGVLLIGWALADGPVWAWVGVVPLVTGLFNFCPLYGLLGVNTCKR